MTDTSAGWKKSYIYPENPNSTITSSGKSNPIGIQKRRKSSFNSIHSPYTRRRSFLSRSMLEAESLQCYKLPSYDSETEESIPSFSISLSESQGFIWNQDLFATSYQQARAGVSNSLSMSDGTYLSNSGDGNGVDVIDVILTAEDYISDVDVVTEVIKVGNEGIDDHDISESDSMNEEEGDDTMHIDSQIAPAKLEQNDSRYDNSTTNTSITEDNEEVFYAEL
ncbi:hypothetical protein CANINC_001493 [Pichia inconspicua]|uniref:Uncharacterized protein n=1 Tax=Pichia inconspicua TaxID=52247 RepID=A0A4T0X4W6_9ASCO|nr:hypothetical protein CANINC_001493 [[Candida] inconspicua]